MLRRFKSSINVFADVEHLRFYKGRQKSEVYLVAKVLPFSDLSSCLTLGSASFPFSDLKKRSYKNCSKDSSLHHKQLNTLVT